MSRSYDDMIHLPHPTSATHPRMPRANRAAQFSPFAALTGYDAAILEAGRLTDARKAFDGDSMALLDRKLCLLADAATERPEVVVTHFQPDAKKEGGAYVAFAGTLKKVDEYERALVFVDGKRIAIEDILEIECALFDALAQANDACD